MLAKNYSHGLAWTEKEVLKNNEMPSKWINPLEVRTLKLLNYTNPNRLVFLMLLI